MDSVLSSYIQKRSVPVNRIYGGENEIKVNEAIHLTSPQLGEVSLTRKKTPYTDHPGELMINFPGLHASQLTELTTEQGAEFFDLSEIILRLSNERNPGRPLFSINQQQECTLIESKFAPDGTEQKVQTLDPLHAHLFIHKEEGQITGSSKIRDLQPEDKYDFYDIIGISVAEYLYNVFTTSHPDGLFTQFSQQLGQFPFGLKICFESTISNSKLFEKISDLQNKYVQMYYEVKSKIFNHDGILLPKKVRYQKALELLQNLNLSLSSQRNLLKMLSASIPSTDENRKYLRFVQGPAITWIFDIIGESKRAYMIPKILSRGNAMEALGIWVDQAYDRIDEMQSEQLDFYDYLIQNLPQGLNPRKGSIYNFIQK